MKKVLIIFFLILTFILGIKTLGSEIFFLVKFIVGLGTIGLLLLTASFIISNTRKPKTLIKKLLLFTFIALAFIMLRYALKQEFVDIFLEEKISSGMMLFIFYLIFIIVFKLDLAINPFVSLISLCLVAVFALDKAAYSTETFAVFGFLTLIITALHFILKLRQDYETV